MKRVEGESSMKSDIRAARDASIAAKRKAGRTAQSLADEYGLCRQTIYGIEVHEEQREARRRASFGLSVHESNAGA
jgi:predicted transcriptional regulator